VTPPEIVASVQMVLLHQGIKEPDWLSDLLYLVIETTIKSTREVNNGSSREKGSPHLD